MARGLAEKLWKAPGYEQLSILPAPAHIWFISCDVTHSSPFSVAQGPVSSPGVRLTGVTLTSSLEPQLPHQWGCYERRPDSARRPCLWPSAKAQSECSHRGDNDTRARLSAPLATASQRDLPHRHILPNPKPLQSRGPLPALPLGNFWEMLQYFKIKSIKIFKYVSTQQRVSL